MSKEYVERVLRARVYDVARETPLEPAPRLSRRIGNQVLLKREDLQPVFSFKLRGAYNKICVVDRGGARARRGRLVGGQPRAGRRPGGAAPRHSGAVIVMPLTTPTIKVDAVRDLGAEIVLHGDYYDDAKRTPTSLSDEQGLVVIPPFDDPDVIAGQGTIGMEILRQHGPAIDAIFVAIGGGGLAAGVARLRQGAVAPTSASSAWSRWTRPRCGRP